MERSSRGEVHYPTGAIRTRIQAAYLASLLWEILWPKEDSAPRNRADLSVAIREGFILGDGQRVISQLKGRWERPYRENWELQFGGGDGHRQRPSAEFRN
jgi:hypothetical protein